MVVTIPTNAQIGNAGSDLPTIQRLFAEDYKDSPEWFKSKFISTMNLFMPAIYTILNQGVDVTQNTRDEIYSFSFPCNSGVASNNIYKFQPRKFVGKPNGIILGQCYNMTSAVPSAIGNPVTFDWYFSGNQVFILAIYGLTSGQTYSISLRIY